jgi:hypothetical protein
VTDAEQKDYLKFAYKCTYLANDGRDVHTPTYDDGEDCPQDFNTVNRITSIELLPLRGDAADQYELTYQFYVPRLRIELHRK